MSFKTIIGQNLELAVQQELSRMANEWFFKWHFIGDNKTTEIDSFRERPIQYGGIAYSGSAVDVYWDAIARYRKLKVAEFFNSVEVELPKYAKSVRRQAIAEATAIIKMFSAGIQKKAVETDKILRGDGINLPERRDLGRWEESGNYVINQRSAALADAYCAMNIEKGDYYVIEEIMTEELSFLKADGTGQVDGVKGLVTGKKLITFDVSLPVQPNDRFLRQMPSGLVEEYIVENPGFQSGVSGAIKPHFQIDIRRSDAPPASPQTIINHIRGDNSRVNINSVDNSQNLSLSSASDEVFEKLKEKLTTAGLDEAEEQRLLKAIEAMENSHDTPAFKEKYQDFMAGAANHATVFGTLLGALAQLL